MSIIKNYLYNTVYQIMSMLIPLITMPYLTRVFNPLDLGLNSYSLSIANYFMLFGMLGMQMYGNRQIAYVRDDKEKLAKTFWSLYVVQLITSTISLISYYLVVNFFTDVNTVIYLIQGLNIVTVMIDISWLFMGLEDFKKVVIRNTIARVVGLISIFIFVKSSDDLLIYALLTVVINIVSILLMWAYVPKYVGKFIIDKKIIRRTIRPLLRLFLPQIATQVYSLLARTLVGFLSTNDQVIFYDYSQKIVNIVLSMITSIGVVLLPRVSNIIGNGKRDEVPKIIEKTFKIVSYMAIPMSIGLMCVSQILVSWFLDPEYLIVGKLTAWTALIIIAVSWANIIGVQYLIATKQENKYTISIIIAAFVNLVMNLFLIKEYGASGAIISLIVAEYIGIVIQLILVRKQLPIKNMLFSVLKYFAASAFMAIFVILVGNSINNGIVANLVQAVVGIVVYIGIMFVIKDEVQKELITRVMSMIKKK